MNKVLGIRTWRTIRQGTRNALKNTFCPFLTSAGFLQFLSWPTFLWLVFFLLGAKQMGDEAAILLAGVAATLSAVPLLFLINLILSPFRVHFEEKEKGVWQDGHFVYHEPQLLASFWLGPAESGVIYPVVAQDAEPNSLVSYKIEYETTTDRLKAQIIIHPKQQPLSWDVVSQKTRGSLRVGKSRTMYLISNSLPETVPASVRIYMLSWDLGKGTHVVMEPIGVGR